MRAQCDGSKKFFHRIDFHQKSGGGEGEKEN
jgi:hypothetical protein